MYGLMKYMIASQIYNFTDETPQVSKSGKVEWKCYASGLYLVVERDHEIICDAKCDADSVDGLTDIEFADEKFRKSNQTRQKAMKMLKRWVTINRENCYPPRPPRN